VIGVVKNDTTHFNTKHSTTDPMPEKRDFGWTLKPTSSTHFDVQTRDNGQICIVLNHSLLRDVTAEMLHWWFANFIDLKVKLVDIDRYTDQSIPAYLLWHPSDHLSFDLKKNILNKHPKPEVGVAINLREAFDYENKGWGYSVDHALKISYCRADGWAITKQLPLIGNALALRVHFKDVINQEIHIGAHYHCEMVIGVNGDNSIAKMINKKITSDLSLDFFDAWHLHSTEEAGAFENFLPALYKQRKESNSFVYQKSMNKAPTSLQFGFSRSLFQQRVQGYIDTDDVYAYQASDKASFLHNQ
jgi:hypothetical protein